MDTKKKIDRLAALVARRSALEAEIDGLVCMLRSPGLDGKCEATWKQIADVLNVTPQAVQQQYRFLSWGGRVVEP